MTRHTEISPFYRHVPGCNHDLIHRPNIPDIIPEQLRKGFNQYNCLIMARMSGYIIGHGNPQRMALTRRRVESRKPAGNYRVLLVHIPARCYNEDNEDCSRGSAWCLSC